MRERLRVAVLMGGVSDEREISLKSGGAVASALREAGHEVIPFDVVDRQLSGLDEIAPEVAFIALHGAFGEDGGVQRLLERKGIPYTGSGPEASRTAMDKLASKRAFVRDSVPVADYLLVDRRRSEARIAQQARDLGFPLVCKPADSGSSLGVTIVRDPKDLPRAISRAFAHGSTVFLERYVRGREFTVGILDGKALPMIELVVSGEFFDYVAKYEDSDTRYITPVALIESVYRKALDVSVRAYDCLGCRHFARVDLRYGYDGGLYVLELNTIPGFTPRSLLPLAAAQAGTDFTELCDSIVRMAVAERRRLPVMKKAG